MTSSALAQPRNLPAAVPREWHWPEYAAEFAGTAFNIFAGLSAVVFNLSPGMPGERAIPSATLRLLLTGLIYAGSGSLFAISPWGRLSGAHINPSVTLAFWAKGKMHGHDVIGYLSAQFVGATCGALLVVAFWGSHASAVHNGMTLPGRGYSVASALLCEFVMTFFYVFLLLCFVNSRRLMRWTPLMSWIVVALLVCVGAGISGTSLNAARSFGPALVSWDWSAQWIYLIAPTSGGLAAALMLSLCARERGVLTAKLYHTAEYRSIFRKSPRAPAGHPLGKESH